MKKTELLQKLHGVATEAKLQQEKERLEINEGNEVQTYENMAQKLVSKALSEENLLAAASRGAMSISVLPLKKWVSPLQLDPWQQAIFDEIRFQGFEPLVISELDPEADDHTDYYIGIQWKKV